MVASVPSIAAFDLLRWIPLIPLMGSVINLFFGRAFGKKAAARWRALRWARLSRLPSIFFGSCLRRESFAIPFTLGLTPAPFKSNFSFQVDALSAVMLLIVTGVGFLIHLYSIGYMEHDEGIVRFFVYLNLFIFFMLLLVMADNLLCSLSGGKASVCCLYLLIGFWYHDPNNSIAGNKAFIVNRIGDFGFHFGNCCCSSQNWAARVFGRLIFSNCKSMRRCSARRSSA